MLQRAKPEREEIFIIVWNWILRHLLRQSTKQAKRFSTKSREFQIKFEFFKDHFVWYMLFQLHLVVYTVLSVVSRSSALSFSYREHVSTEYEVLNRINTFRWLEFKNFGRIILETGVSVLKTLDALPSSITIKMLRGNAEHYTNI